MEFLINVIIDNQETQSENILLNYNKKRIKQVKRRNLLLKSDLKKKRRSVPKVSNYLNIIKNYPEDVFQSHFWMARSTFMILRNSIQPYWTRSLRGRLGHSLEMCLYVTLWKLGNSNVTFRELSDRFGVAKGTTHKIFFTVIKMVSSLKNEIIWPSAVKQRQVMERFERSRRNPFPKNDAISYYNRKGNHTIILQAICDSKFRFLDVFIGCPGSCHDAHVWKTSPIYKGIISGEVELAENAVILGDSAYPLSKFLLTPYRDNGHLRSEERNFNYCLSSTRVFIEQSYGILKQKFKILNYINLRLVKKASMVIFACTILHNLIINRGNPSEYLVGLPENNNVINEENENHLSTSLAPQENDDLDGIAIRRNLTTLFCS